MKIKNINDNVLVTDSHDKRGGYVEVRNEDGKIIFSQKNMITLAGRQHLLNCLYQGEKLLFSHLFVGTSTDITTPDFNYSDNGSHIRSITNEPILDFNITDNIPINVIDFTSDYLDDVNGIKGTEQYITIDGNVTNLVYNEQNFSSLKAHNGIMVYGNDNLPVTLREDNSTISVTTTKQPFIKITTTISDESVNTGHSQKLYHITELGLLFKPLSNNNEVDNEEMFSRLLFDKLSIGDSSTFHITYYIYF